MDVFILVYEPLGFSNYINQLFYSLCILNRFPTIGPNRRRGKEFIGGKLGHCQPIRFDIQVSEVFKSQRINSVFLKLLVPVKINGLLYLTSLYGREGRGFACVSYTLTQPITSIQRLWHKKCYLGNIVD